MSIRSRILAAGVELLQTQGIATLTQPRIAKVAGVSQSHLTYYFPTRSRLLLAIAETAVEQVVDGLGIAAAGGGPADLAQQLGELLPRQAPVRVLLGLIVAADHEPELREALSGLIGRVRARFGELLGARGFPVTPDQLLVLHAALVGLAVMNLARQSDASLDEVRRGVAEVLRLVAADDGRRGAA